MVEGRPRRDLPEDEPLADAARPHHARAVVAVGVVAWPPEEGVRGEGAAAQTHVAEVARRAVPPEPRLGIVLGALAREAELGTIAPDVAQCSLLERAANVARCLQRRT